MVSRAHAALLALLLASVFIATKVQAHPLGARCATRCRRLNSRTHCHYPCRAVRCRASRRRGRFRVAVPGYRCLPRAAPRTPCPSRCERGLRRTLRACVSASCVVVPCTDPNFFACVPARRAAAPPRRLPVAQLPSIVPAITTPRCNPVCINGVSESEASALCGAIGCAAAPCRGASRFRCVAQGRTILQAGPAALRTAVPPTTTAAATASATVAATDVTGNTDPLSFDSSAGSGLPVLPGVVPFLPGAEVPRTAAPATTAQITSPEQPITADITVTTTTAPTTTTATTTQQSSTTQAPTTTAETTAPTTASTTIPASSTLTTAATTAATSATTMSQATTPATTTFPLVLPEGAPPPPPPGNPPGAAPVFCDPPCGLVCESGDIVQQICNAASQCETANVVESCTGCTGDVFTMGSCSDASGTPTCEVTSTTDCSLPGCQRDILFAGTTCGGPGGCGMRDVLRDCEALGCDGSLVTQDQTCETDDTTGEGSCTGGTTVANCATIYCDNNALRRLGECQDGACVNGSAFVDCSGDFCFNDELREDGTCTDAADFARCTGGTQIEDCAAAAITCTGNNEEQVGSCTDDQCTTSTTSCDPDVCVDTAGCTTI